MDFFISNAWAQAAGEPDMFVSFLPLILIFVIFYFLLIRPQTKRAKEHRKMVSELKAGDEVVTGGGIVGRVQEAGEQFLKVEVADGVVLRVQRQTVVALLPKGTFESV
ncbi:MAG TPA: preprotein translocase subunit YajC [Gammaproteobacteria bacterium]|nr:preprotein translocase subunit YajC [Gammaproteobacteria bacterium]